VEAVIVVNLCNDREVPFPRQLKSDCRLFHRL
jgi:hypothetical protein